MEFQQNEEPNDRQPNHERSRIRVSEQIIRQRQRTQAAERARRYRERIRTNGDVNSQSVENVDISNSQNSSEFQGNNSNLSNHRSRSRLRQTSEERRLYQKE